MGGAPSTGTVVLNLPPSVCNSQSCRRVQVRGRTVVCICLRLLLYPPIKPVQRNLPQVSQVWLSPFYFHLLPTPFHILNLFFSSPSYISYTPPPLSHTHTSSHTYIVDNLIWSAPASLRHHHMSNESACISRGKICSCSMKSLDAFCICPVKSSRTLLDFSPAALVSSNWWWHKARGFGRANMSPKWAYLSHSWLNTYKRKYLLHPLQPSCFNF